VDIVLLCTPPHFRPAHFAAAVAAGKHCFVEKPVAVDAAGVRAVLAASAEAERKKLSVVSGLCWRYDAPSRELVKRVQAGAIGDLRQITVNDFRGPIWVKPRQAIWSDMEYQMRNWYYFSWLSGDVNVEQHVHLLDLATWMAGDRYPVRAHGVGGRSWRNGKDHGNIFDHHAVTYEYADGLRVVSTCRQYPDSHNGTTIHAFGTKGTAVWGEKQGKIVARKTWEAPSTEHDKFQAEHDEMMAAIRRGRPINNGVYMAKSTLMGIMGREATYTGQLIKWDELEASTKELRPAAYAWGPTSAASVPVPGPRHG